MDDLISRRAAIDALAENMPQPYTPDGSHPADEGNFMVQEIYADCIQTLKELPSAQPERKTGKWIKVGDNCYECSNCKELQCCNDNFCTNCGADMRGE